MTVLRDRHAAGAGKLITQLLPRRAAVAATAAATALAGWVGTELVAIGSSASNLAREIESKKRELQSETEDGEARGA